MKSSRRVTRLLIRGLLCALGLLFLPYVASRLLSPWRIISSHSNTQATPAGSDSTNGLRLAAYNIAHGRGDGPSSRNWTGESRAQRLGRLDAIADLLRTADADVVVLNEVDFDTSWSRGINQARYLADKAGYPYWVEERNLDFRFLFWKWRFGNAILSRHPIARAAAIDLPSYSSIEAVFAGKKRGVVCDVDISGTTIRIAGVHLCHRSESVRAQSAEHLSRMAAESDIPFFVLGDLNSTPIDFMDSPVSESQPNAIRVFDGSEQFRRLPMEKPASAAMTFHSANPDRVIDWILIPRDWEFRDYAAVPSDLSDHRMVRADAALPRPAETASVSPEANGERLVSDAQGTGGVTRR